MSTCRSCGAEILWAITDAGKRMPISVASRELRIVVSDGPDDAKIATVMPTYVSHFADCPNADQHRKPT